jgi:hypothetical protein
VRSLLRLLGSAARRIAGLVSKAVAYLFRPAAAVVRRVIRSAPSAMHRHRERASEDRAYSRTVADAIGELLTTVIERPPYASIVAVLLTTWLGTVEFTPPASSPTVRDVSARTWPEPRDPVPLWDRLSLDP